MKSLQRTGTSTTARTASRSACEPPKRRRSVRTLITRAPPAAYCAASSAGSGMAARSPFDGLRRFTSAITPTPGARKAASASRAGRASSAAAFTSASGSSDSRTARSSRTPATISSSTFMSVRPRAPLPVARPSPRQSDRCTHSRGGAPTPLPGGGGSGSPGFRYPRSVEGPGSAVGSSPRSSAFQAAWARSSSVSGRRGAVGGAAPGPSSGPPHGGPRVAPSHGRPGAPPEDGEQAGADAQQPGDDGQHRPSGRDVDGHRTGSAADARHLTGGVGQPAGQRTDPRPRQQAARGGHQQADDRPARSTDRQQRDGG